MIAEGEYKVKMFLSGQATDMLEFFLWRKSQEKESLKTEEVWGCK